MIAKAFTPFFDPKVFAIMEMHRSQAQSVLDM